MISDGVSHNEYFKLNLSIFLVHSKITNERSSTTTSARVLEAFICTESRMLMRQFSESQSVCARCATGDPLPCLRLRMSGVGWGEGGVPLMHEPHCSNLIKTAMLQFIRASSCFNSKSITIDNPIVINIELHDPYVQRLNNNK